MTRSLSIGVATALALALIAMTGHATAQDYVYEIDGHPLTAAEGEVIRQADASMQSGYEALQRRDWSTARRHCQAGLAGYARTGLPDVGRVSEWYANGRACVADTFALTGQTDVACGLYRENEYRTLVATDPRPVCERREAAEADTIAAHDAYSDLFAEFADMTGRLQTLPEGSQARADLGQRMFDLCGRMNSFSDRAPGAFAGASYCTAIVRFEAGQPERACTLLWEAARWTRDVDTSQMLDAHRRHVREMDATLMGFRQTCADFGYPWPASARR